MKTDLAKFKEQFQSLAQFIADLHSNDRELEKIKIKINLGLDANPRLVCNKFVENIVPFADHILSNNDEFFLNMDYTDLEDSENELTLKLKAMWADLEETNREKIRKYFKILLVLGCLTTKNEELREIINSYRETPLTF